MAGAITLLAIAVILTEINVFLLTRRMNRQEDTMVHVLLALAILLQDYDKKQNKNHLKKNNKATKKGE